jgi:SAF domain
MSATAESRPLRLVAGTVQRRWRLGALLGLLAGLVLAAYGLIVLGPGADVNQMVSVLRAARPIQAGSVITADDLTTSLIRTQDPSVLATLIRDTDRSRIIGQTAALDVPAGDLIPIGVVAQQSTSGMVRAQVPIRIMPADLKPGDHVLLLVSATAPNGAPVDIVYMQDVRVLQVGQGSAELWIPTKLLPQVVWYGDHGGIVLATMQPGDIQQGIPAGGAAG